MSCVCLTRDGPFECLATLPITLDPPRSWSSIPLAMAVLHVGWGYGLIVGLGFFFAYVLLRLLVGPCADQRWTGPSWWSSPGR